MELSDLRILEFFIGAGLSAVIACLSIYLTVSNIRNNRRMDRERLTLEFISQYSDDAGIGKGLDIIHGVQKLSSIEQQKYVDKIMVVGKTRAQVLVLLNKFEVLAIGLKRDIYDQKMIQDFFAYDICVVFDLSMPFIYYIREKDKDPEAFREYEKLYIKWPVRK